ncbi:putative mfs dha1 multidrug resistance protein [Phaeomoniella chlamydospora]|uniref:Putative mfs dha1 multidrug resistance protein n=1 Tax=Phaeomoniella chlamydospora TaxID=158046 RepID=A0A0G2GLH9_PHACM|nr:putative mfs dha1 multidrug resistance protein [Phaeomoniella chlamydospora]
MSRIATGQNTENGISLVKTTSIGADAAIASEVLSLDQAVSRLSRLRSKAEADLNTNPEGVENEIWWAGDEDPANPMNWAPYRKWAIIANVGVMCFFAPLASSMFAPAIEQVMEEFHNTSATLSSFVVSVYVLGFAFGPPLLGPLSELYGRRFGSSGPLNICGGTVGDLFKREDRGVAMSIVSAGPIIGPAVGPIGVNLIATILFTPETYAPKILEWKTRRLRKETGNLDLHSRLDSGIPASELLTRSLIRPVKMFFIPIVFFVCIVQAIVYGFMYLLLTTFSMVFREQYGFGVGISGLTYLGLGLGNIAALVFFMATSDRYLRKRQKQGKSTLEDRLVFVAPSAPFIAVSLFCLSYIVDVYGIHAASALSAVAVLRCLGGAFLPLAGRPMYNALGIGWGNSLLGFISVGLMPLNFLLWRYGGKIRTKWPSKL